MATTFPVKKQFTVPEKVTALLSFVETRVVMCYLRKIGFDPRTNFPKTLQTSSLIMQLARLDVEDAEFSWGGRKEGEQFEIITIALLELLAKECLWGTAEAETYQICMDQPGLPSVVKTDVNVRFVQLGLV